MPEPRTINIDEIADYSERLPVGRGYIAKLAAAEGGKNDGAEFGKVVATWEVIKGEYEGRDARSTYTLYHKANKTGAFFAPGISEMKRIFAAIGKALPKSFGFPSEENAAARLFGTKLKGVTVELAVFEELAVDRKTKDPVLDDEGKQKKYQRVKVMGVIGTPAIGGGGPLPATAEDEFDGI
jgi:hypothetical protein